MIIPTTNQLLFSGLFLLIITAGCGGDVSPQEDVPDPLSMLKLIEPERIAAWEASDHNFYHSKIKTVELSYFYDTLGNNEPKPPHTVAVEICGAQKNGIAPEQQQALDFLIENEKEIHAAVRQAVYAYYKEVYPHMKQDLEKTIKHFGATQEVKIDEELPPIVDGTELDEITDFSHFYIHPVVDGKAQTGIEMFGKWDPLDGVGIRLQDGKIVGVSNVYDAMP